MLSQIVIHIFELKVYRNCFKIKYDTHHLKHKKDFEGNKAFLNIYSRLLSLLKVLNSYVNVEDS